MTALTKIDVIHFHALSDFSYFSSRCRDEEKKGEEGSVRCLTKGLSGSKLPSSLMPGALCERGLIPTFF